MLWAGNTWDSTLGKCPGIAVKNIGTVFYHYLVNLRQRRHRNQHHHAWCLTAFPPKLPEVEVGVIHHAGVWLPFRRSWSWSWSFPPRLVFDCLSAEVARSWSWSWSFPPRLVFDHLSAEVALSWSWSHPSRWCLTAFPTKLPEVAVGVFHHVWCLTAFPPEIAWSWSWSWIQCLVSGFLWSLKNQLRYHCRPPVMNLLLLLPRWLVNNDIRVLWFLTDTPRPTTLSLLSH